MKGKVAIVRTMGMKIHEMGIRNHANTPYTALLVSSSPKEDVFLKQMENESHTEIDYKRISNKKEKANAEVFLSNLRKEIRDYLNEFLKENTETDGEIDTKDLINSSVSSFTDILKRRKESVMINVPGNGRERVEKRSIIIEHNAEPSKDPEDIMSRSNANKKAPGTQIDDRSVFRIIEDSYEEVEINVPKRMITKTYQKFDIQIMVIDGAGEFSRDKFNLLEFYKKIWEKNTGDVLKYEDELIKDVPVMDGKINIEMEINDNANTDLKFAYFLEGKK